MGRGRYRLAGRNEGHASLSLKKVVYECTQEYIIQEPKKYASVAIPQRELCVLMVLLLPLVNLRRS